MSKVIPVTEKFISKGGSTPSKEPPEVKFIDTFPAHYSRIYDLIEESIRKLEGDLLTLAELAFEPGSKQEAYKKYLKDIVRKRMNQLHIAHQMECERFGDHISYGMAMIIQEKIDAQ